MSIPSGSLRKLLEHLGRSALQPHVPGEETHSEVTQLQRVEVTTEHVGEAHALPTNMLLSP